VATTITSSPETSEPKPRSLSIRQELEAQAAFNSWDEEDDGVTPPTKIAYKTHTGGVRFFNPIRTRTPFHMTPTLSTIYESHEPWWAAKCQEIDEDEWIFRDQYSGHYPEYDSFYPSVDAPSASPSTPSSSESGSKQKKQGSIRKVVSGMRKWTGKKLRTLDGKKNVAMALAECGVVLAMTVGIWMAMDCDWEGTMIPV
jgi:hypothetical protein